MKNSAGSANQAHFARIPSVDVQRSSFDRSNTHKTTFNAGLLIPFFADEILPGDTMSLSAHFLARLATPIFPYMDNVFMDFHFFFVPNRLVWDNWEKFNGAQDNPDDSTDFLVPQLDQASHAVGFNELTIYDYLRMPTKVSWDTQAEMPNALIPRAYNLIWNEWFRDENLQDSVVVDTSDGPDTTAYDLLRRGRRKDYFTSCLPWPQKGPSVLLPLGGTAPITGNDSQFVIGTDASHDIQFRSDTGGGGVTTGLHSDVLGSFTVTADQAYPNIIGHDPTRDIQTTTNTFAGGLLADLSAATAATINQMREAFQLQRLFERDARGGTRYVEILLSHFGVISPDFRLQRPEYLGGGSVPINVNPIAQTSETTGTSPQANLSAFATAKGSKGFNHSFVEHGHIIGLVSVRADTTYQQGLPRMYSRRSRYDFYWPTLAHLGEQAVLNKEIYFSGTPATDEAVFGYQERFAEYRYFPSSVTGLFRSNATVSLDAWHLALEFVGTPPLAGLVEEQPPIDRIIAVPSEPHFIFDSFLKIRHTRPMPTYSVPGLIDHF